ncbi:MAG: Diacylglycerol kinase [Microgenomates group bacterium GW2011_GWC1_43_11]|uniref:Diacylglycerol kinase n=2 Tax=Candidatus Gottesmaniibacteriota TaxID=1752720 RepID=A0A0G1IQC5_9BACT|nr:MAG: Diacylglycerol kinase [Microgenomates group bacterium GW2011_GWC1_43_11]KKT38767.1 MAG: Diacylglycerol kinase [Candidatus Gottesmanbacteria bacterium GW2011_GWB1_44_11c]KKT61350.1 MAG: Diacylglycerol kinase [Candidatus Gottesmanbacteria bacterium GW2011_GWA1_44_24b]HCM82898.1 diacylglycerol kinase [Patescibacteria group bacterium]
MEKLIRQHTISFKNAFSGLVWAVKTQPNFRVHIALSLSALVLGSILSITYLEMIIIVFTIILGLTCELINTSIEAMTDLITSEHRENAKIAKDVAAGMMLTTAIGAVVVAIFIFVPHLLNLTGPF